MSITVQLTETQMKTMQYASLSPQEWVENLTQFRANEAVDEIVSIYTEKAIAEGIQIPLTKEEIVTDAFSRGWVLSGQERQEAADAMVLNENTLPE